MRFWEINRKVLSKVWLKLENAKKFDAPLLILEKILEVF